MGNEASRGKGRGGPSAADPSGSSRSGLSASASASSSSSLSSSSVPIGGLSSPVAQQPLCLEDFDLLKVVGKGSFGKVYLVRKKGGKDAGAVYAMKTLHKDVLVKRGQLEHTRAERKILEAVHHPFIVSLKSAFQSRDKLYIVTEFCSGGELFFWLKRCVKRKHCGAGPLLPPPPPTHAPLLCLSAAPTHTPLPPPLPFL